jgi:hypothetical protein
MREIKAGDLLWIWPQDYPLNGFDDGFPLHVLSRLGQDKRVWVRGLVLDERTGSPIPDSRELRLAVRVNQEPALRRPTGNVVPGVTRSPYAAPPLEIPRAS